MAHPKLLAYLLSTTWLVRPDLLDVAISVVSGESPGQPELVKAQAGKRLDGSRDVEVRDGVGIISIIGPIVRYADMMTELCGGATVEMIARDIKVALNEPYIKSILLNIDGPGGQANGISELGAMIRDAATRKPLVAYVGGEACSAHYWLASSASEIVIDEIAVAGSIGAVTKYPVKKADGKYEEFVSTGSPMKRPDVATERGRAEIQRNVDDLGERFVNAVAINRGVSVETVLADFGQGGILIGQKAVEAGLVDRVGSFEAVLAELSRGEAPKPRAARTSSTTTDMMKGKPMATNWFTRLYKQGIASLPDDEPIDFSALPPVVGQASSLPAPAQSQAQALDIETDPKYVALKAKLEAADKLALSSLEDSTRTFVLGLVKDSRLLPAVSDATTRILVQLAQDDRERPVAGTRYEALKTLLTNLPKHTLLTETAPADVNGEPKLPPGSTVIPSTAEGKDPQAAMTPSEVDKMLGMTDAGRAILASRKSVKV